MYLTFVSFWYRSSFVVGTSFQKGTKTDANQANLHDVKKEKSQTSRIFLKETLRSISFKFSALMQLIKFSLSIFFQVARKKLHHETIPLRACTFIAPTPYIHMHENILKIT